MKAAITSFFLFIFTITFTTHSQFGWIKIYSDDTAMGISYMKAFSNANSLYKDLYIIKGVEFQSPPNPDNSGKSLKYDRTSNAWYEPLNGFLNADWCFCICPFTCNPPRFVCNSVLIFTVSRTDTMTAMKNMIGGCGCDAGDITVVTQNGGKSESSIQAFSNGFAGALNFGMDVDPVDENIIYTGYPIIGGSAKWIYKSTNKGENWQKLDSNSNFNRGIIKVSPLDRTRIFASSYTPLMLSTNSGESFFPVDGPGLLGMSFNLSDSVIFGNAYDGIYRSTNHGFNWVRVLSGGFYGSVEVSPDSPMLVYAGSSAGLHRSTDGGNTWVLYNDSFNPSKSVISISKDHGSGDTLYVATHDAVYKVYDSWLGINLISANVPASYSLFQNFPNPFNPVTKIRFNSSGSKHVKIEVYDVSGKLVSVPVNGILSEGTFETEFNGTGLSSGIYFYSMYVDSRIVDTRKMVLTK